MGCLNQCNAACFLYIFKVSFIFLKFCPCQCVNKESFGVLLLLVFLKTLSMSICQWQKFWVSYSSYIFQDFVHVHMSMTKVLGVLL